jgi:hypothetical protein
MRLSWWGQFHDYKLIGVIYTYSSSMAKGTVSVLLLVLKSSKLHMYRQRCALTHLPYL